MRLTIVALAAGFLVQAHLAFCQAPTGRRPDVGTGNMVWFDLVTNNMDASKEFYSKLFGWTFNTIPGTDHFVRIVNNGKTVGDIRVTQEKYTASGGVTYIQVPDIQKSCDLVKELGGSIPEGFPFNTADGAISIVVDPVGNAIGIYSHKSMPK